jgi:hypothetical protein
MRYRLRTLLIVLALGPPVLAGAWYVFRIWRESRVQETWTGELSLIHGTGQTVEPDVEAGEAP